MNLGGVSLYSELASMTDLSVGKSDEMGSSLLVKSGIVFVPFHMQLLDFGLADERNEYSATNITIKIAII